MLTMTNIGLYYQQNVKITSQLFRRDSNNTVHNKILTGELSFCTSDVYSKNGKTSSIAC